MADPRLRQLTIKSNIVKRLAKDIKSYEKEIHTETTRLEKLRANGAEEAQLKKQQEVIEECRMMVPESMRRLERELATFESFLENEKHDLAETEQYQAAQQILVEAKEAANTKPEY